MIGAILLWLANTAVSATSFNLVCTGTVATYEEGRSARNERPFTTTYRVDLKRGRWCSANCSESHPIYSVTDGEIVFQANFREDGDISSFAKVNRETGSYSDGLYLSGAKFISTGKCEPAAFTGLPGRKF